MLLELRWSNCFLSFLAGGSCAIFVFHCDLGSDDKIVNVHFWFVIKTNWLTIYFKLNSELIWF